MALYIQDRAEISHLKQILMTHGSYAAAGLILERNFQARVERNGDIFHVVVHVAGLDRVLLVANATNGRLQIEATVRATIVEIISALGNDMVRPRHVSNAALTFLGIAPEYLEYEEEMVSKAATNRNKI